MYQSLPILFGSNITASVGDWCAISSAGTAVSFGISLSSTRSVKSALGDEHTKDLPCRANSSFDPRGCKIEDP